MESGEELSSGFSPNSFLIAKKVMKNNSSDHRFIVMFFILVILLIVGLIGISISNHKNQSFNDSSLEKKDTDMYLKEQVVDGILFSHIRCEYDGNFSLISYTIKNQNSFSVNIKDYEITIFDKDGNYLTTIAPYFNQDISPNEEIEMENVSDVDLSDASEMKLNISK